MPAAATVLRRLVESGFDLVLEGGSLVVSPASKLTDGLREHIRTHRDGLIALLDYGDDDRRRCTSCAGYRGRLCPRPKRSGLVEPGTLATHLQRCAGFEAR